MNLTNLLIKARGRIANRENWTVMALARDRDELVLPTAFDFRAVQWCAQGACVWAVHEFATDSQRNLALAQMLDLLDQAADELGAKFFAGELHDEFRPLVVMNDVCGHRATLNAFDLAIERRQIIDGLSDLDDGRNRDYTNSGDQYRKLAEGV
jgi:hypothetical protein